MVLRLDEEANEDWGMERLPRVCVQMTSHVQYDRSMSQAA